MSDEHLSPTNVEPTAAELKVKLDQALATNARLLDESRSKKDKYRMSQEELERINEENASKEKDINKIIEAEKKKTDKFANENKKLRSETLGSRIRAAVSRYAGDVIDLEDLLNQPKYGDILKKGIDADELTVDEDTVKLYVETVLKEKPYLRKQNEATTMMTKKPSFQLEKGKTMDNMTSAELQEMAKQLYGNK